MSQKVFHIYAKDKCLFHNLEKEEFETTWSTIQQMVGLMKTEYQVEDLSYEELSVHKQDDASYWQSIHIELELNWNF